MLGVRIVELEPAARVALMEWCYVVCSHQEVRGTRPGERAVAEPAAAGREHRAGTGTRDLIAAGVRISAS